MKNSMHSVMWNEIGSFVNLLIGNLLVGIVVQYSSPVRLICFFPLHDAFFD